MTRHEWGEEDFDWNALNECCDWFPTQLHRWARFPLLGCKEKYGTMRFEWWGCTHGGIWGVLFPGRLRYHYPGPTRTIHTKYGDYKESLLHSLDDFITKIARRIKLTYLFWLYQKFVFNIVTIRAVKKWPHIKEEILAEYEFQEMLYKWVKKYIGYECHWVTYKDGKEVSE